MRYSHWSVWAELGCTALLFAAALFRVLSSSRWVVLGLVGIRPRRLFDHWWWVGDGHRGGEV